MPDARVAVGSATISSAAIHDGLLRDLGPHLSSIAERNALPSIDQRVCDPVEPVSAMRRQAMDVFTPVAQVNTQG